MEKKIIKFLVSHPEISISGVEKEVGMPRRTLKYSIDGTRRIPEKYIGGIVSVLSGYGFDVGGYEAEGITMKTTMSKSLHLAARWSPTHGNILP